MEHLFGDGHLIKSLYSYMYDKLEHFWDAEGVTEKPNFEDALHVITQLGALPPEHSFKKFTPALGAFVQVFTFPEVGVGSHVHAVDSAMWRKLANFLVYGLVDEFRKRCSSAGSDSITILKRFFDALASDFDVAIVTTNYDDLIHRSLPTWRWVLMQTTTEYSNKNASFVEQLGHACFTYMALFILMKSLKSPAIFDGMMTCHRVSISDPAQGPRVTATQATLPLRLR
jgi:hypothetical protein